MDGIKRPDTVKQLRALIGLLNWQRTFVSNFSDKVQPIIKLLKTNNIKKEWGKEQDECLTQLIREFKSTKVLAHPDFSKEFILFTDASKHALGAVLCQCQSTKIGERAQAVAYFSRTLTETQRNYSVVEQEALAVTEAVTFFRPFIYGMQVNVYCDQRSLIYLFNQDKPSKFLRWRANLAEYNLSFQHVAGHKNTCADFLSRFIVPTTPGTPLVEFVK